MQTKIAGVSRICSVPFLVAPGQITSFIHSASTHILMVEQIRVPFSKGLPYFICTWTIHIICPLRQLYGFMSDMAGIQPVSL
ncbi:MAG: hypothetical protein EZS28_017227 [Streblomastix strix]|uniref:Uncharacterized protein n=1 Tax=Streblomastix strix TaxID=222440 RepID=A0A5J4VX91_9EUKA|nr:MAG: hypothetical protein EZS28_017227 [Streblomastix strix]